MLCDRLVTLLCQLLITKLQLVLKVLSKFLEFPGVESHMHMEVGNYGTSPQDCMIHCYRGALNLSKTAVYGVGSNRRMGILPNPEFCVWDFKLIRQHQFYIL